MKKLISITLAIIMAFSTLLCVSFAAETTVSSAYALKGASISGANHSATNTGDNVKLYIAGSNKWSNGRMTLLTFDLSAYTPENIPDRFYFQIGTDVGETMTILRNGQYHIDIYETDDNSDYQNLFASYAGTLGNDSVVLGDIAASMTQENGVDLITGDKEFYGLRANITESIVKHIKAGAQKATYILAIDPAKGMINGSGETATYLAMYFAHVNYGSYDATMKLRPTLIGTDIPEEDVNTLKSVNVKNGLLISPFESDVYDNEDQNYEIAVLDNTKPVSILYELASAGSYVEGEITEGDLEFGPDTLSIPVYSESGILRTYNFKIKAMDDELKKNFSHYNIAESTLGVCPGNGSFQEGANGGTASTYFRMYEYPGNSVNLAYGRVALIRYDISEIPETATDIYASISMNKGNSSDSTFYEKEWLENDYTIGVYAVPNDYMKWGWNVAENGSRSITFADVFVTNPKSSVKLRQDSTKLGTIDAPEEIEKIISDKYTSIMANGVRAKLDITNYVQAVKKANPDQQYITLMYGIDSWDYQKEGAPSTFGIYFRGEKYVGGTNYDNYDEFRPRLDWYDFGIDSENGIENLKIDNGILTEEFDPYAVDDYNTLTKTYEIAVLDEASDVSINYDVISDKAVSEGAVTTGNLEFGPATLTVPVTSESGITRTYNFKLVKMDDEMREKFADYTVAASTLIIAPQGSPKVMVGNNKKYQTPNESFNIYNSKDANGNMRPYGRIGLIKYDISEIPETAQEIKASVSMTYEASNDTYGYKWLKNDFELGVYAFDNKDMKWQWGTSDEGHPTMDYNTGLFVNAPATVDALKAMTTKLGTIEGKKDGSSDDIRLISSTAFTSVMANGIRAEIDITGYVKDVKAKDPDAKYITLAYSMDDFDVTNPGVTTDSGITTFGLYIKAEQFLYNPGYTNYEEFRPRVDWYDFGFDSENGIENVKVENGLLVEEFDPYAVDDYSTLTKTYKIAVLDETADVSVNYDLISKKSTDDGAIATGNIEFGPKTLVIPVTSESGATRTYKFELVKFADAGLNIAYPSVSNVFRAPNHYVAKDTDMFFIYGNTNITDGSKFDSGAIKLYSPNFAEMKIDLDDETLAYADANGKFGLHVKANSKSLGNTLMVVPSYKYLGKEVDGEEYVIKADAKDAAATIGKVGDVVGDNGSIINSGKISYSLKATNYRNDIGTVDMFGDSYPGAMRISGWASNSNNYSARRVAVLQFALTDDMLDAENIEFSFGANSAAQTNSNADSENMVKAMKDKGIVITVSEATNLNNEWKYKTDRAGILAEGETAVAKSRICDIEVNDNTLELIGYNYNSDGVLKSHHGAGFRIHGGGEEFTAFIKNKIRAGEKLVNLTVEISELQSFYDAKDSNVQGLYIWGAAEYTNASGFYKEGKNYMHPFLASIRWE